MLPDIPAARHLLAATGGRLSHGLGFYVIHGRQRATIAPLRG